MKKNMEQLTQSYRIDQGEVIKASKGAWFSNTIQELKEASAVLIKNQSVTRVMTTTTSSKYLIKPATA